MRGSHDPGIPCHRVVAAGGALGGYGGNPAIKRALLRAEGLTVTRAAVKGFGRVRWHR